MHLARSSNPSSMPEYGDRVELIGTLVRDEGGFALSCEGGKFYRLQLPRVPVDEVEKRVRVIGRLLQTDVIEVEGVAQI